MMAGRPPERWRGLLITLAVLYFTFLGGTLVTDLRLWPHIVHHALVTLLLAAWLIVLLRRGRPIPSTPLDWAILAGLLASLLATIFALDPRVSLEATWLLGVHALLFYLIVDLMRTCRPHVVLQSIIFASSVVVLIGLFEFASWYFGLGWLPMFRHGWFEIGGLRHPLPPTIYRLSFTLGVSTSLSGYLALLIPVGLAWAVATRSKDTRQGLLLWLAGTSVVEMLSFSRGGLVSLAVSLPVLVLLGFPDWRGRLRNALQNWRVRAGLAGLVLVVVFFAFGWTRQNLAAHQAGDAVRRDLWRSAWRIGLSDPLTGAGPGGYGRARRTFRDPEVGRDHLTTPHNVPLLVWSQSGLPGILTFTWLIGATALAGYRRWRAAAGPDRVRVAGVCAGLLGFAAQNLFDTLLTTPSLLPVLALAAYLVTPQDPARRPAAITPLRRLAPGIALALVLLCAVGWSISDRAQIHFDRALRLYRSGDLQGALAAIENARRIDPAMGFYAAQRAQFLGELSALDPAYLPEALAAYHDMLTREDTYDLIHADYAALLAEAGDLAAARREMAQAARILPTDARYWVWSGAYAEADGDTTAALAAYRQALDRAEEWATSGYWETTPLRAQARTTFLETNELDRFSLDDLAAIPSDCWPAILQEKGDPLCAGRVALRLAADPQTALRWFDAALAADRDNGMAYALRAETHLALGHMQAAEQDAQIARFLGEQSAYTVLGDIAAARGDLDAAIEAYSNGGPLIILWQGWDVAVYGRRGSLSIFPRLDSQRPSRYDFASWTALARLYTQQGRLADAEKIYQTILALDPYYELEP
jgi:tetratricopeptide (TPR) repeat protein